MKKPSQEELLKKIAATNSVKKIVNLSRPIDNYGDDNTIAAYCNKVIAIAAITTDQKGINLLGANFIEGNLSNTSNDQNNEIRIAIYPHLIAAADTTEALKDIKSEIFDLGNNELIKKYFEKLKSLFRQAEE